MHRHRMVRIYRPSQQTVCAECRHPLQMGDYHLAPLSRDEKGVWCSVRCAEAAARAGRHLSDSARLTL